MCVRPLCAYGMHMHAGGLPLTVSLAPCLQHSPAWQAVLVQPAIKQSNSVSQHFSLSP